VNIGRNDIDWRNLSHDENELHTGAGVSGEIVRIYGEQ